MKFLLYQFHNERLDGVSFCHDKEENHLSLMRENLTNKYHEYSKNSASTYCAKYDIAYVFYDTLDASILMNPVFGFFYGFKHNMFDSYDAVCFLDTDILITTHATNVFDHYDPDTISVYKRPWLSLIYDDKAERKNMPTGKINTGVVIIPKALYKVFKEIDLSVDTTNYGVYDEGVINKCFGRKKIRLLPNKFNFLITEDNQERRMNQSFLHYIQDKKDLMIKDFNSLKILKKG